VLQIVDDLRAGLPDERREADERRLGPDTVDVGRAVAVGVARHRFRRREEVRPGPVGIGRRDAEAIEQLGVPVDDQARDVLRQAQQAAVEPEGVERLRVERVLVQRRPQALAERLEHVARGELTEATVIDEEQVGRFAARECRRQLGDMIPLRGHCDQLDPDAGLGLLEGIDERAIRADLVGVAEDLQAHHPLGTAGTRARRQGEHDRERARPHGLASPNSRRWATANAISAGTATSTAPASSTLQFVEPSCCR
jgi:hypothetical protein